MNKISYKYKEWQLKLWASEVKKLNSIKKGYESLLSLKIGLPGFSRFKHILIQLLSTEEWKRFSLKRKKFTDKDKEYWLELLKKTHSITDTYEVLKLESEIHPTYTTLRNFAMFNFTKGYFSHGKFGYTIQDMDSLAKGVGILKTGVPGNCISSDYKGINKKLKWLCGKCGNIWKTTPINILHYKSWCPDCSKGYSEKICRIFFEKIFKKKFPSKYLREIIPNFKRRLSVDGYNSNLRIAFEFQGPQHYKYLPFFHYSYDNLLDQKRWDKETYDLCKANKIYLIVIPYTLGFDRIQDHIVKEYKRLTGKSLPILPKFDFKLFLIGNNQIQYSLIDFLNNDRFKLKI